MDASDWLVSTTLKILSQRHLFLKEKKRVCYHSHTNTNTRVHTHVLSLSLSLSHTHTHTHAHIRVCILSDIDSIDVKIEVEKEMKYNKIPKWKNCSHNIINIYIFYTLYIYIYILFSFSVIIFVSILFCIASFFITHNENSKMEISDQDSVNIYVGLRSLFSTFIYTSTFTYMCIFPIPSARARCDTRSIFKPKLKSSVCPSIYP